MKPQKKQNKLSIKIYLFLFIGLAVYFLVGGYAFNLFPKNVSPIYVGVGVFAFTIFLIYYLNNCDD
jgi:small neutral amino acid transporter SnatA (MarC family)